METYLVGGAVRDRLLGLPVLERDWVVVGGTEAELLAEGYTPVGKDFPVFLHPRSKEEYALARIERKTGTGHKGFECESGVTVTLEDDLMRRDLTINAIAEKENGELIDPYGGLQDIKAKILRHVSDAFKEDPLRILRVARFQAKLPNFSVAPETRQLLADMVGQEVLAELPPERIYAELDKALGQAAPGEFFGLLDTLGAGKKLWPELQQADFAFLAQVASHSQNRHYRFAALLTRLAPKAIRALCKRIKTPGHLAYPAIYTKTHYPLYQSLPNLGAEEIVADFYALDLYRNEARFNDISGWFSLLAKTRGEPDHTQLWSTCYQATLPISARDVDPQLKGPAIGNAIRQARVLAVQSAIESRGPAR